MAIQQRGIFFCSNIWIIYAMSMDWGGEFL